MAVLALWRTPAVALGMLFLLPPVLARVILSVRGKPAGALDVGSEEFLTWWALACLQTIFVRFPFLEELLRMVPLVYSAWLRLWGSRIGAMIYWAPGTVVLDRSYLEIENGAVLGVGARLCPHHRVGDKLWLAPISLEAGAQVGGYVLLAAGCRVEAGESAPATLRMRPFSRFSGGRLWRMDSDQGSSAAPSNP